MQCDGCTFCCRALDIPWMDSPAGQQCSHATSEGCGLWPNPPAGCKSFACMYRNESTCNEATRPDNCGAMFEKASINTVLATVEPQPAHLANQTPRLGKVGRGQVSAFLRSGLSVVVSVPGNLEKVTLAAPGRSGSDVANEMEAIFEAAK